MTVAHFVLKRAERTSSDSARAGVTVNAGCTKLLGRSGVIFVGVDLAGKETLDVAVEQQREVELHDLTAGGFDFIP